MNPLQLCPANTQIRDRFTSRLPLIRYLDRGTHQAEDIDHANAGGVHADMPQCQIRPLGNRSADQKKCRRGDICRHINCCCCQAAASLKTDTVAIGSHPITKTTQHAFGMIPRRGRFDHATLPFCIKAGQQHTGFHLSTRHRHLVMDGIKTFDRLDMQRRRTSVGGIDGCAHA